MIRSSPCDYYLKFLCTHPDGYADHSIRSLVKLQQLDFLGMDHLRRLRASCTPPTPFYPEDKLHHESQRFLTRERIYSLHHPNDDKDVVLAIKLLDNPRGKELTESVLAAGGDPAWTCILLKNINIKATPRAVELYRHFYFNTDLVNSTELRAILNMRQSLEAEGNDPDDRRYRHAYSKVAKHSMLAMAASSPASPFSHVVNMMRLGQMPSGIDLSRVASTARMTAVIRSLESSMMGQAERARDFALTGKIMHELLEAVGDVSGDLQKSLMSLSLDTDAAPIPSIKELTDGNHTIDVMPELVDEEEEVVNAEAR